MNSMMKNSNIHCTVKKCKYNMGTENYCSLSEITVGTHESNPTSCECVDCKSFECGDSCK